MLHTVLADTVKGGDVVLLGDLACVAVADGDGVNIRAVQTQGVFLLQKEGTNTFAQGAKCYLHATNKTITSTASGNTLIGVAFGVADAAATHIEVALKNGL